ncbi:hypothetical protein SDRG_04419 [Saprolegnia diclina VS20]|uniref:DUF1764-domain-containing protein n=1 Tax=Saprolegnia diclina (strain VS20) TaxID=1156394 RepID=T0QJ30_SAPDV|nr:hypothetical protein SDRG_04419 [Saprolegnia diclina VS20]EQC37989.1 hypothetical protein SDRG_04419 [Saprolegnia diclina VS20]|eukprot:XP_008608316.1 hypothetical protein SDRG_04419 [Saprolegnia diclina VS20]
MAPPPATKSKLVQKIKPNKAKKAAAKVEAKQATVQVAATNTVVAATKSSKKKKKKAKQAAAADETNDAIDAEVDAVAEDDGEDKVDAKMELDALFSGLKAKKKKAQADTAAEQKRLDDERAEKLAYRKKLEKIENEYKMKHSDSSNPVPVRYDADGLPIYTAASLRINQGGDTADCPFDCWCCF